MARRLRSNREDGWYHVFHRGIERREVFRDDADRGHFLELLGEVHERYRVVIHAYCLMGNHWHGVVQTPEANLSGAMQWLHLSHAAWFNARHQRVGPLWQGRFRAVPIEDGAWAYEVSLYVHLNPVSTEAYGLGKRERQAERRGFKPPTAEEVTARLRQLREYPWSSYRRYGGYGAGPQWLETEALLKRAAQEPKRRQAAYRRDARQRLAQGVEEATRERLRDAIAIGGDAFVRQIKALAQGGSRETSGRRALRRRVSFPEIIEAVARVRNQPWAEAVRLRGDPARPLAIWAARRYAGLTLREIGEALGGIDYAAVSIALKRFLAQAAHSAQLTTEMQQISQMLNVET